MSNAETRKAANILSHFYAGESLNRFEAERIGDHCLNSTVSTLANRHGLAFHRQRESVPNRFGGRTSVNRYRLAESSRTAALDLLNRWRVTPGGES